MEGLSVEDVCKRLKDANVDSSSVEALRANEIDGEALLMLVNDVKEFSHVIPKAVSRLKIRKFVNSNAGEDIQSETLDVGDGSLFKKTEKKQRICDDSLSEDSVTPPPLLPPCKVISKSSEKNGKDLEKKSPDVKPVKVNQDDCTFDINNIVLPSVHSGRVQDAIKNKRLGVPENRLLFIRECVAYFEPRLPRPTTEEYAAISKKFCDTYPELRSPHHTNYWHTFNSQFAQRYRNVRRESKRVVAPKLTIAQATVRQQPLSQDDSEMNYDDNVKALAEIMSAKGPPAPKAVMELLDATRSRRTTWMKSLISIGEIMKTYPCFKSSKWLLYEVNKICEIDVATTMSKNWLTTCNALLLRSDSDADLTFNDEKQALQIVEKNIYHKKPSMLVVTFAIGGTDIEKRIVSKMMEPRLVIFHDDATIEQIFVCAENEIVLEVPSNSLVDGLIHLMATYYVFNVQYPGFCKPSLFFFQDVLMGLTEPGVHRPTRYSTFMSSSGLLK